ncbi:MAG: hypothetical protein GVY21_00685 [Gammaproteobacteria bacterium]|jgi:hypothetical protein|nr:hypothetical protein [Gammaproteobacteria bacterium]
MTAGCRLPVDHVGILADAIAPLKRDWEALGFRVVGPEELVGIGEDGKPRGLGQYSAHVMFADDYIELTAVERPTPGHHLARFLDAGRGLRLIILAADDIDSMRARLDEEGLAPGPVNAAARDIRYGAGGTARFRWFPVAAEACPEALVACAYHETPEIVFQPEVARHANTACGISRMLYTGEHLPAAWAGLAADEGVAVEARPLAVMSALFGPAVADCPPFAGIGVFVRDPEAAAAALEASGIPYARVAEGLAVAPDRAGGVGVLFEPQPT